MLLDLNTMFYFCNDFRCLGCEFVELFMDRKVGVVLREERALVEVQEEGIPPLEITIFNQG